MKIGKFRIGPEIILMRFYQLLSHIWFIPFGFYRLPILETGKIPHPLAPRNYRDLLLNKMMFPDNINRAIIADKIAARGWVAERIGKEYLVPLYDICNTADKLRLEDYPLPFVVKSNHASGQYHFVFSHEDFEGIKEKAKVWLAAEFNPKFEWVYRNIDRKLVVEKMLVDSRADEIWDIKVFCFHGKVVVLESIKDRANIPQKCIVTPEWEKVDATFEPMPSAPVPDNPQELDEVLRLAKILAVDFDLIRVDFVICNGQVYFGELTNFTMAGTRLFVPISYDKFLLDEFHRLGNQLISDKRNKYRRIAREIFSEQHRKKS